MHIIDSATAVSRIRFLKQKTEAAKALCSYLIEVETQFSSSNLKMKRLWCEDAKENMTKTLTFLLVEKEIKIFTLSPYPPESYGLVEGLVQEHWSRARVFLTASALHQYLWAGALFHVNWIRNRTPSSRLQRTIHIFTGSHAPTSITRIYINLVSRVLLLYITLLQSVERRFSHV